VKYRLLFLVLLLLATSPLVAASHPVLDSAQKRITAFHAGEKTNHAFVRIVYFHAADREPLPDYAARLDRVMTDISAFYREEMESRFSLKTPGLPLERNKDGKLTIHLVKGKHPAAHYQHESGDETWKEVRQSLGKKLDADREHVLILYGLCEREPSGRFVFTAPYYGAGWSDQRHGLCHAADCDLLDPALLTKKDQPFVFREHYYDEVKMSVAQFNSWYLGGIAHELGHGLGFPHDNGGPNEAPGIALMGGGNLHYRENLWGGKQPSYLSLATALRFAAHPLTTQSDKARWLEADAKFENLTATAEKGILQLKGRVRASIPPCAVIASIWPSAAKTDHGASTFCSAVDDEGNFTLELSNFRASPLNLTLCGLLVNGAQSTEQLTFNLDRKGVPEAAQLTANWMTSSAEQMFMRNPAEAKKLLTPEAIAKSPTEAGRRHLQLLYSFTQPEPTPVDLAKTESKDLYLSDAKWTKASVGWGKVSRNRFWFSPERSQGVFLKLNGEIFEKGLYAHSESSFTFPLAGRWGTFSATIGLRDGAADQGSAIFTVLGDGKELYRSKTLRAGKQESIRLDISGVKELELRAKGGEDHNHNSWAIWAAPLVQR
jgi:hypothetical protein